MSALNVAFLWHMHQPCYRESDSRVFRLPWVRLHGLKDYYDMVAILQNYPELHQTFNLVPVLLEQLQNYASGKASDVHLELSRKAAEDLSSEEKTFLLKEFFKANWDNMIDVHPRYKELLKKRGRTTDIRALPDVVRLFSAQDFRDLQVWFNLCWTDPMHFSRNPDLSDFKAKGSNYTESEKNWLLDSQTDILKSIIPLYRKIRETGQIEISTTPYYHPILPLLCDNHIARESMPEAPLPARYCYPRDAEHQIVSGLDYIEKVFENRPKGMWPSEGSVSQEAVALMEKAGVKWLASDEGILERSLAMGVRKGQELARPEILYNSYRYGACRIFFRDRILSDMIGFNYYNWEPKKAAQDFVSRLETTSDKIGVQAHQHIASIILDGENVWEFFPADGQIFLNELYAKLAQSPKLKCCTFSEYMDQADEAGQLKKIFPGSWINSDFRVWIGAADDNTAWELLLKARKTIEQQLATLDAEKAGKIMDELYIAEGSDWCWWYGGDYFNENLAEFDALYRSHLQNIYKQLGLEIPEQLYLPLAGDRARQQLISEPIALISPAIDGKVTEFYEWSGSGLYDVRLNGETMHRSQSFFKAIYFGFDANNLYLRLDPLDSSKLESIGKYSIKIELLGPARKSFCFDLQGPADQNSCRMVFGNILEMQIPFALTNAAPGENITLIIAIEEEGTELERHPSGLPLSLKVPDKDFEANYWQV